MTAGGEHLRCRGRFWLMDGRLAGKAGELSTAFASTWN